MTVLLEPTELLAKLQSREPLLWLNPHLGQPLPVDAPLIGRIRSAQARFERCAPLLALLFPELESSAGRIESQLMPADELQQCLGGRQGKWFIKRDDELPIAGSIKARGGLHEILSHAEAIAIDHGLLQPYGDSRVLASAAARALFSHYRIAVGSTGNLGLSIGVIAAALGFDAVVHMSTDAKQWKKERLRNRGVRVVEHAGDYAQAVASGRAEAAKTPRCHFVDDERSSLLFLGYAAAAAHLATQLAEAGRRVDAAHPLFVHIPCGVGGAPGGIAYGLKALFGDHVHCFFAEPVASPCMLVQLASGGERPVSVYDVGLDNRTDADGLAVGQASSLVAPLMAAQLAGVFTVSDLQLYALLLAASKALDVSLEPSAAAGIAGPGWLENSDEGLRYRIENGLDGEHLHNATHVIWATGGSLVPAEEQLRFLQRATRLCA